MIEKRLSIILRLGNDCHLCGEKSGLYVIYDSSTEGEEKIQLHCDQCGPFKTHDALGMATIDLDELIAAYGVILGFLVGVKK